MLSLWERTAFGQGPHLVVIGGGLVGLFTALHYQRRFPAHRVVVLERGSHPSGASVKNAGFACFGSPSELLADIAQEGEAVALARVEERWRGLLELRAELGDEAIGFEPTGGYELFHAADPRYPQVAAGFDRLNGLLQGIFGRSVFTWRDADAEALGLHTAHLAFTDLEGPLDSGRLMQALLTKVVAAGIEVRWDHPVSGWDEQADGVVLRSPNRPALRAAQVVVATNGYLRELLPQADVSPARGQVLLTSPIDGLRLRGTFHAEEGYYYFRDHRGRVLLGGGRHLDKAGETTTADATTPLIQGALEHLLREVIVPGKAFSIEQRWSGVMGFRSQGKSPLVEAISPRMVVAAGLSGMGVAIGIRVARKAAGLVADL